MQKLLNMQAFANSNKSYTEQTVYKVNTVQVAINEH